MGFTSIQGASKADVVKERIEPWQNDKPVSEAGLKSVNAVCLAHAVVGNCLWSVWEHTNTYIQPSPLPDRVEAKRYIALDLLSCDKGYGWGYKDMCESAHPYYYNCPVKFLDMVPVACEEWRKKVFEYHDAKKTKTSVRRDVQVGQFLKLIGANIPYVQVVVKTSKNKIIGAYGGRSYSIAPRFIDKIVNESEINTFA